MGHLPVLRRARDELAAAEAESAAGSGLISVGPVTRHLQAADEALAARPLLRGCGPTTRVRSGSC
ncbi:MULTISPECIES: hypothetical protein [unclassified Streptomyces]|uniref:hypothetical protein n=1 Tax=unclassified Streptomyces TaxID=2593676 RepID=UPI0036EB4F9F